MSDSHEHLSIEDVDVEAGRDREGLPSNYRMRADQHYVDQLAGPAGGQPVRMVPLTQIELDGSRPQADLRPLIESIRVRGIVQPLLVRRQDARFVVVAGKKRLMAAQMLRLPAAPCLVNELTDLESAALAEADNLTVRQTAHEEEASPTLAAVRRLVSAHLATIRSCADIGSFGSRDAGVLGRSGLDLLRAHAWRASQLLAAFDLLSNAVPASGRERALATLVDEVIDGFAPEARLGGIVLRADIREALSSSGLNDRQIMAGLIGAVFATLPLVEHTVRPAVTIKASSTGAAGVLIEVVQADAPIDARLARQFFQDDLSVDRPGGYAATLGAVVAKAVAEQHSGTATFEATDQGSRLTMLVMRRS